MTSGATTSNVETPAKATKRLVAKLQALGHTVTLQLQTAT